MMQFSHNLSAISCPFAHHPGLVFMVMVIVLEELFFVLQEPSDLGERSYFGKFYWCD